MGGIGSTCYFRTDRRKETTRPGYCSERARVCVCVCHHRLGLSCIDQMFGLGDKAHLNMTNVIMVFNSMVTFRVKGLEHSPGLL